MTTRPRVGLLHYTCPPVIGGVETILYEQATRLAARGYPVTILSGRAGNAWFEVLSAVVSTKLKPQFAAIEWEFDLAKRHARCAVAGQFETVSEPIRSGRPSAAT